MKIMRSLSTFPNAAYVLDKDGTLLDTESIWFEANDRLLISHGLRYDVETHRRMMGTSSSACVHLLQARHPAFPQGAEAVPRVLDEMYRLFRQVREERGVRRMAGVQTFLEQCRARGIPLAIATSAKREDTDRELECFGWSSFFKAVVTADDITRHKPAPDIYLEASRRLEVGPSQCLAFEDSISGTKSAHAAGMQVIFLRDPRFEIPVPPEATLSVASFEELL